MDEPTNHLDIKSKNVLKAALQKFEGTLLLVSHDRDFLQGMANVVYEFKDQKIREYLGDINFYLEQRNMQNMREVEKRDVVVKEVPKENKQVSYQDQKKNKTLQNKLSKIESQIQQLTLKKKEVEAKLRHLVPGRMAVDPETGEVIEGAYKTSKSTYRVTLAK